MSRLPKTPPFCSILMALVLTAPQAVRAQEPRVSLDDLKKQYDAPKINLINDLMVGKRPPRDTDEGTIRAAAEWYVYRLRFPTWQAQPNRLYNDVVKPFVGQQTLIQTPAYAEKNQAFQRRYNKELLACFRDVLNKNSEPQVVVSAALMFPSWAKGGQEEVADYLAELVRDPKRLDAIKLYALRGLGEYFKAAKTGEQAGPLGDPGKKAREAERINAVIDFVKRKSPVTAETTPEQFEAVRYVRREALRALAQVRVPALDVDAKRNKVLAPVAVTLLAVLAGKNAGIDPAPSMQEVFDAAVALCQMKGARIGEYDQTLALSFIALALADFAKEYNEDYKNVIFNDKQRGSEEKKGAFYPWLAQTARFREGLTALVKNTQNDPAAAPLARELSQKAELLLKVTEKRKLDVDRVTIEALQAFAQAARPKLKIAPVFRGVKDKALEIPIE